MPCDLERDRRDRAGARPGADRGRGVRRRQRDSLERRVGADRPPARRHRLLLVPSAQGADHRRRRHDHHRQPRVGSSEFRLWRQHAHDRARHHAARVEPRSSSRSTASSASTTGMTDLQAAIGRVQLAAAARPGRAPPRAGGPLPTCCSRAFPTCQLPVEPAWARSNWQSYCVRLPDGCDQARVMQAMLDEGISTRRGVMCAHLEPAYRREPWRCGAGCPSAPDGHVSCSALQESEEITDDGLMLPLFDDITDDGTARVASSLARGDRGGGQQRCLTSPMKESHGAQRRRDQSRARRDAQREPGARGRRRSSSSPAGRADLRPRQPARLARPGRRCCSTSRRRCTAPAARSS